MNISRKNLTYYWVLSLIRTTVSSFWDYLSLALSSLILMSLFVYVFQDLLTRQLANLPQLASISIGFGLIFGSVIQSRLLLALKEDHDLISFGRFILAPKEELRDLNLARYFAWVLVAPIAIWYYIAQLPSWNYFLAFAAFTANLSVFTVFLKVKKSWNYTGPSLMKYLYFFPGRLKWRLIRLLVYNHTARNMLITAFTLYLIMAFIQSTSVGFLWLFAFAAGQLAGTAHAIIASEDLRGSWLEKNAGLSHSDFISTHLQLAGLIASMLIIPGIFFLWFSDIHMTQKISLIMAGPCVSAILPGILLQIDGKRPEVTTIVLFLLGLFIATAILAHPLSICLTFLVISYGMSSQTDRYYRQ